MLQWPPYGHLMTRTRTIQTGHLHCHHTSLVPIGSNLVVCKFKYLDTSTVSAIVIIVMCTNGQNVAIFCKGNGISKLITIVFAIDGIASIDPCGPIPKKDTDLSCKGVGTTC